MVLLRTLSWVTKLINKCWWLEVLTFCRPYVRRTGVVVISTCTVGWLLLHVWLGPVSRNTIQITGHSVLGSEPSRLPELESFLPSPSASKTSSPRRSLSDYLFPKPSDAHSIPKWTAINHEMFKNLFRCIERNSCAQNQTKGGYHRIRIVQYLRRLCISSDYFFARISFRITGGQRRRENMVSCEHRSLLENHRLTKDELTGQSHWYVQG